MSVRRCLAARALLGGGLVLLAAVGAISAVSVSFIVGTGHAQRPILPFLSWYALAGVAMGWAFWSVRGPATLAPQGRAARVGWILAVSLLARLLLVPSQPIQEVDSYRYLWDGHAVLHGVNPYRYAPAEVTGLSPGAGARSAWQDSTQTPAAQAVLRRISYPEIRTVYPPLAQGLFAAAQRATPWSLAGWRILVLVADVASLALVVMILRRGRLPLEWAMLYGWSPLILKEFGNSLHVDVFVVLGILLMMAALQRGWHRLAFFALALAALVKLAPGILVVALFAWVRRCAPTRAVQGAGIFLLTLLAGYLPFRSAGPFLFDGLARFVGHWQVNDSVYTGLAILTSNDRAARLLAGGLVLVVAGVVAWRLRRGPEQLPRLWGGMLGLLAALFLLLPTGNPWYFTWMVPFLTVVPVRALLWCSVVLGLYYLDFYFMYRGAPHLFSWVRWVEYGSVAAVGGWELRTQRAGVLR